MDTRVNTWQGPPPLDRLINTVSRLGNHKESPAEAVSRTQKAARQAGVRISFSRPVPGLGFPGSYKFGQD